MERYGFSVHLGLYDENKVVSALDALQQRGGLSIVPAGEALAGEIDTPSGKAPCRVMVEKFEDGTASIQLNCVLEAFAERIQKPSDTPDTATKNARSVLKTALEPVVRDLYCQIPFSAAAIGPDVLMTASDALQLSRGSGIDNPEDGFVLQFRGGFRLVTVVVWSDPAREKLLARAKELVEQITRGEVTLTVSGQMTVDGAYVDYVTSNGWRIRVFNESSRWGGLEYLITPENQILDFNDLEHAPDLKEFTPKREQLASAWHWMQA